MKLKAQTTSALPCPCGSQAAYADCCAPFHQGLAEPISAEVLMRSRFSAFALGQVEWLWSSLHPSHDDRRPPRDEGLERLRQSLGRGLLYRKLEILDQQPPDREGVWRVLFLAVVKLRGRDLSFVELSSFAHDGSGLRYLCGVNRALGEITSDLRTLRIENFAQQA